MNSQDVNVLIVGLITPYNKHVDEVYYFEEFKNLVHSNGIVPCKEYFTKLRSLTPSTFLTKGKLEEIQKICFENDIDHVVFSEILNSHQEAMLNKALKAKVFDRTHLILEIFEKNAHSGEGKLQVQIAFLEHKKSRVSGRGEAFSQQSGIIGTRGSGETQKEIDLQHIDHLLHRIRKELKALEQVRMTQRKQRLKNQETIFALIGYTNAGKSSLLNVLTKSDAFVKDLLFATLDTTTRECFVGSQKIGLISDTVGFIQNLPHRLIEAFKSTLHELTYADVLLHVVDVSNPDFKNHIQVVNDLLKELNLENKKQILIFNKVDKIDQEQIEALNLEQYKEYFLISTLNLIGIEPLKNFLKKKPFKTGF